MRKASLALSICLSIYAASLYAACKTEACKQAVAWKKGFTAIVLDDNISRNDYFAVLNAVKANNGIVAIEAERVLLGWVPATSAGKVHAVRGVSAVLYEAVASPAVLVQRHEALAALSFFNRVRTGEYEDNVETSLATHAEPLTGCTVMRPSPGHVQSENTLSALDDFYTEGHSFLVQEAGRNVALADQPAAPPDVVSHHAPRVVTPQWGLFMQPYRNVTMRGRITVQLFRLDSDGTVDPNYYTWTNTDFATAHDQVYSAFTFWVDQATARGITLSFRIETEDPFIRWSRSFAPTPTHYEPIKHYATDDYLWVNDALAANGYAASPVTQANVYDKNEAYNLAKAADPTYGPFDGSFSIYVIYNPGVEDRFMGGQRAYSVLGGPFEMVMWNSAGWGPYGLGNVITHETGHIFWACDEYYYPGPPAEGCFSCTACYYNVGPRNQIATPWITNANCDNPTAAGSCDIPLVACMMRNNVYTLCPHTPGQIGW
jgi:hypothetical protein